MENSNPKISVIVPVYKAEAYLHRCVDSLLAQTFQDYEILLVDDGSPDRSGEICDEYAKKDPRVRVFHKENGGVSSARNLGIRKSRSNWCCFIDADDYIEILYLHAKEKDILYVNKGYYIEKHDVEIDLVYAGIPVKSNILPFSDDFMNGEYFHILNSPWMKIFLTKILREDDIYYDENISLGEDHLFVLDYLLSEYIRKVSIIDGCGYRYVKNKSSETLSSRFIPYEKLLQYALKSYEKRKKLMNKLKLSDKKFDLFISYEFKFYILRSILSLMSRECLLDIKTKKVEYKRIRIFFSSFDVKILNNGMFYMLAGQIVSISPMMLGFYTLILFINMFKIFNKLNCYLKKNWI